MTTTKIKNRRGPIADLKLIQLDDGEIGVTMDTKEMYVGISGVNVPVEKIRKSLVPVDYNNKINGTGFFRRTAGTGTLAYDATESAMGKGCFSITGNGTWVVDNILAIAPLYGIGGQVVIKGIAAFSVGVQYFDANGTVITGTTAQTNFVANSVVGSASFALLENYVKFEGAGNNNVPAGARHARPFITVSGNSGTVKFDHMDVYQLMSFSFFA